MMRLAFSLCCVVVFLACLMHETEPSQDQVNRRFRLDFKSRIEATAAASSIATSKHLGAQWTWLSGSDATNVYGSYGTKGVASSSNYPGGRYRPVALYRPSSDSLFIFGGFGYDVSGDSGDFNDLWRYNITDGKWTWLSGNDTMKAVGSYGTKGVASSSNYPGARNDHVGMYHPSSDSLLIFGGFGYAASATFGDYDNLNDLWQYNIVVGKWTWISGNDTKNAPGSYGMKGVASSSNYPGGRRDHVGMYHPSSDSLFIFGGFGYAASGYDNQLNDLWRYNITDGKWTWLSGSDATNVFGSYGMKGVASSSNYPGARNDHVGMYHPSSDSFFIFGGVGYAASGDYAFLNDLWQYRITDGKWTWLSGSDTKNAFGSYGMKGVASSSNYPGARSDHVALYHPSSDSLFIFGGVGFAASGYDNNLNDLWQYNITDGKWTWLSGNDATNVFGSYGMKGVASSSNYPGGRRDHVGMYHPSSDSFFIFGGVGFAASGYDNKLNDLWTLQLPESCPVGTAYPFCDVCPVGSFSLSNYSECQECPQGQTSMPGATICTVKPTSAPSGAPTSVPSGAPTSAPSKDDKQSWGLIIGVAIGAVVLVGVIGYACFVSSRRRRNQAQLQEQLPAFAALNNN